MNPRLYVGNLPFSFDGAALRELFLPFGTVKSAKIVADRFSGRSQGFGFVELGSSEEALKAMNALEGRTIQERVLTIAPAKTQDEKRQQESSPLKNIEVAVEREDRFAMMAHVRDVVPRVSESE